MQIEEIERGVDLYARLHRALHPQTIAGRDVPSRLRWQQLKRERLTGRLVACLRVNAGRQRMTIALLCGELGIDTRDGRAEVSSALSKLLQSGRVVRRRGVLAGLRGWWWYALAGNHGGE